MVRRLVYAVVCMALVSSLVLVENAVADPTSPYAVDLNGSFKNAVVLRENSEISGKNETFVGATDKVDASGNPVVDENGDRIRVLGSGGCFSLADVNGNSDTSLRGNLTLPGWTRICGYVEVFMTGSGTYNDKDVGVYHLKQVGPNDEVYLADATAGLTGVHLGSKKGSDAVMVSSGFTLDMTTQGMYDLAFDLFREEGSNTDRNKNAADSTLTVTLIATDANGTKVRSELLSGTLESLGITKDVTDETKMVVSLTKNGMELKTGYTYQVEFSLKSTEGFGRVSMSNLSLVQMGTESLPEDNEVNEIPEPGTWAMLVGIAAIGGCWYRRRTKNRSVA